MVTPQVTAQVFGEFWRELIGVLPNALACLALVWAGAFVTLTLLFQTAKRFFRERVLRADERIRAWALSLRYKGREGVTLSQAAELPASQANFDNDVTAPPEGHERVPLTWIMRFFTNFASAPSLSFWSVAVPLILITRGYHGEKLRLWLLPGLCFCGSMLLSNVMKRVFKRVRPPRPAGSFGHSMKDASFPSGHSLTSFVFWATMTATLAVKGVSPEMVALFGLMSALIVAFTGLSRVYMGVHFPSDVIGGYVIGGVWSVLSFSALYIALSAALYPDF